MQQIMVFFLFQLFSIFEIEESRELRFKIFENQVKGFYSSRGLNLYYDINLDMGFD